MGEIGDATGIAGEENSRAPAVRCETTRVESPTSYILAEEWREVLKSVMQISAPCLPIKLHFVAKVIGP